MQPSDPLTTAFRLVDSQRSALKKLGVITVQDLLYHAPVRYEDITERKAVAALSKGDEVVVYGRFTGLTTRKTWKSRRPVAEGWLEDGSGRIKVIWFNQPYIAKMLQEGVVMKVAGVVSGSGEKRYLTNPEVLPVDDVPSPPEGSLFRKTLDSNDSALFAVYPESQGITSKWFRHAIDKALSLRVHETIEDPIPDPIRARYHLPSLATALVWLHQPRKKKDAESARKRFAFEEIFGIQVARLQERHESDMRGTLTISPAPSLVDTFVKRFPFTPTNAQKRAIKAILADLKGPHAMARLLEGDVGSGKTAVAATIAYAVTETAPSKNRFGKLQVAYMAPTEILAKQHFESFIAYFRHLPVSIGLITSSGCQKFPSKTTMERSTTISRTQLLTWIGRGDISIVIGTHALIQKNVVFKNLGLVIIDEQHRFGTMQRLALTRKDALTPHLLSMTATPIPRTLALTLYGDLDLTILDEMPKGRKPIITHIVKKAARRDVYEHIRTEMEAGRQAYIICPRIDEPDLTKEQALVATAAIAEAKRLKKEVFPDFRIGIVHSKLLPKEKDKVMEQFARHELDILVATSVVEVGVNVPNATIIIIEGAERFGLAQLHQLRGRVLRSNHQAYCYCFTDTNSRHALRRLAVLTTAKNGFELAEYDLALRGPGELYGRSQSGLSDLGMEALKNIRLVEAAREESHTLIAHDPTLASHPTLAAMVTAIRARLHVE